MIASDSDPATSNAQLWTGRILTWLAVAFFLFDSLGKFAKPAVVVEATRQLGYPEPAIGVLGGLLLACTLLYAVPRTSVLGAILLTAYLGGAVASQFRIGAGWFNITFAVLFGVLVWIGLWLRDVRLRALLPLN